MESPLGAPPPTSSNFPHDAFQEQRRTRPRRGEPVQRQPQPNGDHQQNGDDWVEPPLRTPVPSFQDYPGLTRQGVLETMMPLGTRPTTRVRARAKGDPLRRIVQAKNLGGGLIPDEGSATPEPLQLPEAPRIGTLRTDAASRRESPATDLNADSDIHSSPSRHSLRNPKPNNTKITLKTHASTPSPIKDTSSHETPPSASRHPGDFVHAPVPSGSPFFTAAAMANKNGSPEVQRPLAFLYSATEQDSELERLLKSATNESLFDKSSDVSRKIKQVKKMYRAQNNAPHSRGSSIAANLMGAFGQNVARANNTRHSFSPSMAAQTTIGSASQQSSPRPKPSINSSELLPAQPVKPSLKIRLNNPSKPPSSNIFSSSRTVSPSKKSFDTPQNNAPSITRRSSSSSLSSVDSELANQSSPNMAKRKARRNLTNSKNTRRRGNSEFGGTEVLPGHGLNGASRLGYVDATPEDILKLDPIVEAERQRLDASVVKDPNPMESSIRSTPKPPQGSAPAPTPSSRPVRETRSNLRSANVLEEDDDTPLDLAGSRKRAATPTALGRPPKKPRTKISPIKTQKRPGAANMARPENTQPADGPVGNKDDLSESSETHDTCSACGNPGYLVICDGCDHSWHFDCVNPPVRETDLVGGKWYCTSCTQKQEVKHQEREVFMGLKQSSESYTPKAFLLPEAVRNYFKNVKTGDDGEYEPDPDLRSMPRNLNNQTHEARYRVEKDSKGNWIHCHYCGKTSNGTRDMVQCDYCPLWWHMDCLDPPRANPPYHGNNLPDNKRLAWKCPAHADHDMKRANPKNGHGEILPLRKRIREPKSTIILSTSLSRGLRNNGNIEIESESDEDQFQEEEVADGIKYKLPRESILLDFISKVKSDRLNEEQAARERAAVRAEEQVKVTLANAVRLAEALSTRRIKERLAAFNLTRFKLENPELRLADNDVENLIAELENQAPEEVVDELDSSGTSTQRGDGESDLTEQQRALLQKMQEHIQKLLATGSSST